MDTANHHETFRLSPSRLQMLGPLAGWRDGRIVELGPPLQRATLCILAAQAGQVVTKVKLVNGLWGDRPPNTAQQSIYTYVAGLRRVLEPERGPRGPFSVLVHTSRGYVLQSGPVQTDAEEFEGHLDVARRLRSDDDLSGALRALDAALRSWSGPALCGVPGPFAENERARLEELRLGAREDRAGVLLHLGHWQEAAADLTDLVAEAPLRERARGLYMLALYRCGRQADALDTYLQIQRLLAEKLGVDPSEDLRHRYQLILRADPDLGPASPARDATLIRPERSPAPVSAAPEQVPAPRQLPRATSHFVGRAEELVRLRALLAPWDGGVPQAVVAITGAPGSGKSALAVHAAHALRDTFPDGLLYANLLGATPGVERLGTLDVVSRFLRSLGVGGEVVPPTLDEATAMLRDRLVGRRVLIVLDDAADLDQVRPLLGLPSGNAVLITSRESLAMADDCAQVLLGTMGRAESVTVLAKLVGAERVAQDPAAATRLAAICGGLPLALRLAAARLIEQPQWTVADLVERLEDRRRVLQELESGQIAVRSSLELSHDLLQRSHSLLDQVAARALCHLGVLPVDNVTPDLVAALLDEPTDVADRALGRLARAHLLEPAESGRFRLHDLVRLFTIKLADDQLMPKTRQDALIRVLSFYGATARRAIALLDPHRVQLPWPDIPQRPAPLHIPIEALAWMEDELANIIAAATQAMATEHAETARMGAYVAFSLDWHLCRGSHRNEHFTLARDALQAGIRFGDQTVVCVAHGQVAMALVRLNRPAEAVAHQQAELKLQRAAGNRFGEMRALGNLACAYLETGLPADALACTMTQLEIARQIGAEVGERHALFTQGNAYWRLGDASAAMSVLRQALELAEQAGDRYHQYSCLQMISQIELKQGDPRSAKAYLERALAQVRKIGHRTSEPTCLCHLAEAERLLHHPRAALTRAREALTIAQELGDELARAEAAAQISAIYDAFPESLTSASHSAAAAAVCARP